ncbi:MAG: dihydrofolate reductase [Chloroflexi bacterium]|nr:MAG: dihydrofolate reductase [Chloroflexota bacterium]
MRKLIVLSFITLDGVMQAPGGPGEDESGGFKYGGWSVGYFDDFLGNVMTEQMGHPFDLLLGRKTYDIFAAYWPRVSDDDPGAQVINRAKKYVVSHRPVNLDWKITVPINGDVAEKIRQLKKDDGPEIQVHGSGNLIQTLLKHDVVDEFWLKTFPVALGSGKRLFAEGTMPAGFTLTESRVSPSGVVASSYSRAGEVKLGSFELAASGEQATRDQGR